MHIVLPPSEGKTAPGQGEPLDLAALSFPGLGRARARALSGLIRLCRTGEQQAAQALGLGPRQLGEIAVNARLRTAPCGPAIEVYTGVLFDALDVGSLSPRARRRLGSMVVISSALFGLLRPDDRIPAYRMSADAQVPTLGPLASLWRQPVSTVIAEQSGLILDLRSTAYASLGPIPGAASGRCVTIRVLLERAGKRSVVSHHNKATKGRIVRALAEHGTRAANPAALATDLQELGFRCEMRQPGSAAGPAALDVIVRET
ncbi:MAG: peroxide stress protein YaaA [Actinomycetales bacterium]|nr:peroxide stress protein YaaA [Actinomycetales bacterium]